MLPLFRNYLILSCHLRGYCHILLILTLNPDPIVKLLMHFFLSTFVASDAECLIRDCDFLVMHEKPVRLSLFPLFLSGDTRRRNSVDGKLLRTCFGKR